MVLLYDDTTFDIIISTEDGGDTDKRQEIIDSTVPLAGQKVGGIADDITVLANPQFFIAVETATVLTGTERRKSIELTIGSDPIELNEVTTVSIQLKDKDLVNDPTAGVVISLIVSNGIITPSSITTNSSGQNPSTITYKPTKFTGDITIRAASSTHQQQIDSSFTISEPTTDADQNWLEGVDIKERVVIDSKGTLATQLKTRHNDWFVTKASLTQTFDPGLVQNINSIVADDMGFLYVNGFVGPGATNPELKKVNKSDGNVAGTFAYTNNNLANRFDGMAYDGTSIWMAGANHLYEVDAIAMTQTNDYTMAADGNIQFVAWDGEFIWMHLRGGTDVDKDKIWKVNPATGAKITAIDYRTGDIDTTVREIKQVALDDTYIYIPGTGPSTDWDRVKRSDGTVLHRGSGSSGSFGIAVDNINKTIYVAGGVGSDQDVMTLDVTEPLLVLANADSWSVNFWDALFDGTNVWAITAVDDVATTRRYVRKGKYNPGTGIIDLLQSFDLTTAFDPNSIAFDGKYLYVAGYGVLSGAIKKIFVGR